MLLDYKADVNLTVRDKDSPLVSAAKGGRTAAIKMLIAAGAGVKGEQGKLALKAAAEKMQNEKDPANFREIIEILKAAGAQE